MPKNPYQKLQQYKEQAILTMTPGEQIIALYDGCLKNLNAAVMYIEDKNFEKSNEALKKAKKIVDYLRACLDMKYDIAHDLSDLYIYYSQQIFEANMKKDKDIINELIPMISDLREAFKEADKIVNKK